MRAEYCELKFLTDRLGCPDCWVAIDLQTGAITQTFRNDHRPWTDVVKSVRGNGLTINRPLLNLCEDRFVCPCCNKVFAYQDGFINLTPNIVSRQKQALKEFYEFDYSEINPNWHMEDSQSKVADILQAIGHYPTPNSILDVGCGAGLILSSLAEKLNITNSIGIDISTSILKLAKNNASRSIMLLADAEFLPFRNNSFDLIIDADIIEHVINPSSLLIEQARTGKLVIAKIPVENALYTMVREIMGEPRRENLRRKFGHIHHYSSFNLRPLFNKCKLCINRMGYSKIPNRKGLTASLQEFTFSYLAPLFPIIWGGFAIISAESIAFGRKTIYD